MIRVRSAHPTLKAARPASPTGAAPITWQSEWPQQMREIEVDCGGRTFLLRIGLRNAPGQRHCAHLTEVRSGGEVETPGCAPILNRLE